MKTVWEVVVGRSPWVDQGHLLSLHQFAGVTKSLTMIESRGRPIIGWAHYWH